MSKLRLAIVTGSISKKAGGLFNSVRRSAITLSGQGHEVGVFSLKDCESDRDIAAWQPLVPVVRERSGPAALARFPGLAAALQDFDPDVVHQHGIWEMMSLDVSTWRRRTGRPVMISPRGMLDPWALGNSRWRKRLVAMLWARRNLEGAACLHALNPSEAASMRAFGLKNPIAVIPNGTDLPDDETLAGLAPPDWCADGRKILLFIGRIHPKKGVDELIAAWAKLKKANPALAAQWRIVIAGWDDGGHVPRLQKAVAEAGLKEDVILPGPLFDAQKAAALHSAQAFVLPSYSEGMPMSILEAWAYRLPVLMTEECNLPDGFARQAALRIDTQADVLARQLEEGLSHSGLSAMGLAGRRLVEEHYEWSRIAERHAAVYRWMISGGTAPGDVERA